MPVSNPIPGLRAETAHIGKSVLIRGELSGSEDLYVDGEVEGSIELAASSLTIGPNGRVNANLHAREIVVHGRVNGHLRAAEKVELRSSANVIGDIVTQRIAVEEGAYFKGAVDLEKTAPPSLAKELVATSKFGAETKGESAAAAAVTVASQSTIFDSTK